MTAKSHRDLDVWRTSMQLVEESYSIARMLPKHELFGLASQLRRASVSIPSNIAEGYGRLHRGDYVRHVSIALGSLRELTTLLELSLRLGYVRLSELEGTMALSDRVGRMLHKLATRLREAGPRNPGTPNPAPGTRSARPG
jgi:four helix bundle protein